MIDREDITDRDFEKKLFGYDKEEVEYFQKMVAKEFDRLHDKIDELKKIEKKYERIGGKKSEEIIKEGEQEAEKIISKAEEKADDIITRAKKKKDHLQSQINDLEVKKMSLINSISDIIEQQKNFVNQYYHNENNQE